MEQVRQEWDKAEKEDDPNSLLRTRFRSISSPLSIGSARSDRVPSSAPPTPSSSPVPLQSTGRDDQVVGQNNVASTHSQGIFHVITIYHFHSNNILFVMRGRAVGETLPPIRNLFARKSLPPSIAPPTPSSSPVPLQITGQDDQVVGQNNDASPHSQGIFSFFITIYHSPITLPLLLLYK